MTASKKLVQHLTLTEIVRLFGEMKQSLTEEERMGLQEDIVDLLTIFLDDMRAEWRKETR